MGHLPKMMMHQYTARQCNICIMQRQCTLSIEEDWENTVWIDSEALTVNQALFSCWFCFQSESKLKLSKAAARASGQRRARLDVKRAVVVVEASSSAVKAQRIGAQGEYARWGTSITSLSWANGATSMAVMSPLCLAAWCMTPERDIATIHHRCHKCSSYSDADNLPSQTLSSFQCPCF